MAYNTTIQHGIERYNAELAAYPWQSFATFERSVIEDVSLFVFFRPGTPNAGFFVGVSHMQRRFRLTVLVFRSLLQSPKAIFIGVDGDLDTSLHSLALLMMRGYTIPVPTIDALLPTSWTRRDSFPDILATTEALLHRYALPWFDHKDGQALDTIVRAQAKGIRASTVAQAPRPILYPVHVLDWWSNGAIHPRERTRVHALALAPTETLWIVLGHRLMRMTDGIARQVINLGGQLSATDGRCHLQWWHDTLWLASNGLWQVQGTQVARVIALPMNAVVSLVVDAQDRLVVVCATSVWRSGSGEDWEALPLPASIAALTACASGDDGSLWSVGIRRGASRTDVPNPMDLLRVMPDDAWQVVAQIPKAMHVRSVLVEHAASIWLGTGGERDGGVWHYGNEHWADRRGHGTIELERMVATSSGCVLARDDHQRVWMVALETPVIGWYAEPDQWLSTMISPRFYPVTLMVAQRGDGSPGMWEVGVWTAAYWDQARAQLWLGSSTGDIGWIDLNAPDMRLQNR